MNPAPTTGWCPDARVNDLA